MPQVGFELGSLRLQADVLPIEPPLLVTLANLCIPTFRFSTGFCQKFCKQIHETFLLGWVANKEKLSFKILE